MEENPLKPDWMDEETWAKWCEDIHMTDEEQAIVQIGSTIIERGLSNDEWRLASPPSDKDK